MMTVQARLLLIEAAVSSFLFGAVFPNPVMFLSMAFLTFFFAFYVLLTSRRLSSLNHSSIEVRRELSAEELPEGSTVEVKVEVELGWEGGVEVRELFPSGLRLREGASSARSTLNGRGRLGFSYRASLWSGVRSAEFKGVACTLTDPWRLVSRTVVVPSPGVVRSSKERTRSSEFETGGRLLGPVFGTVVNPFVGEDAHFVGVRPFIPGDKLRSVHWRSTAKLTDNEILVKKFERLARGRVVAVIDCSPEMRFGTSPDYFDDALDFLEPVCVQFIEQGNSVRLFAVTGEGLLTQSPRSPAEVEGFLRSLEVSDVGRLRYAPEVAESLTPGSFLIVVTSLGSAQIPELSELARAAVSMGCRVLVVYPRVASYLGRAMDLARGLLEAIKSRDLAAFPEECAIEELEGVPSIRAAGRSVAREG